MFTLLFMLMLILIDVFVCIEKKYKVYYYKVYNFKYVKYSLRCLIFSRVGSHDSFTYNLTTEMADIDPILQEIIDKFPGEFGINVAWNYSVTQSMTVTEQLEAGIRYFDIRTAGKDNVTDDWFSYHGFYGSRMKPIMHDVKQFLQQHPKEVVLFHFQGFYKIDEEEHQRVKEFVLGLFGDILVPSPVGNSANLTLEEIQSKKQQLIVLYNDTEVGKHPLFWSAEEFLHNPWPNTPDVIVMVDKLTTWYNQGERPYGWFGVTQGVLTPSVETIVSNTMRDLKTCLTYKGNPALTGWLRTKAASLEGINIVMSDFSEISDVMPSILEMNFRT